MGGYGSGKKYWRRTKRTVESCETLDIGKLVREEGLRARVDSNGSVSLTRNSQWCNHVGFDYRYEPAYDEDYLVITYDGGEGGAQHFIRLVATPAYFGGLRLWLTCPSCQSVKRVSKLYKPRGERYFACRDCHKLAYRSSQTSRSFGLDRLVRILESIHRSALRHGESRS